MSVPLGVALIVLSSELKPPIRLADWSSLFLSFFVCTPFANQRLRKEQSRVGSTRSRVYRSSFVFCAHATFHLPPCRLVFIFPQSQRHQIIPSREPRMSGEWSILSSLSSFQSFNAGRRRGRKYWYLNF